MLHMLLVLICMLPVNTIAQNTEYEVSKREWDRSLRIQYAVLTRYAESWAKALPGFRKAITKRGTGRHSVLTPQLSRALADFGTEKKSKYPGLHTEMIIPILSAGSSDRRYIADRIIRSEVARIRSILENRTDPLQVDAETYAAFSSLASYWDIVGHPRSEVSDLLSRISSE